MVFIYQNSIDNLLSTVAFPKTFGLQSFLSFEVFSQKHRFPIFHFVILFLRCILKRVKTKTEFLKFMKKLNLVAQSELKK